MGISFYRDEQLAFMEIKSCDRGMHSERRHAHDEFSLGLVLRGASRVSAGGAEYRVEAGQLIWIPAGVIHDCRPEELRLWSFKMLYLQREWIESWFPLERPDWLVTLKTLSPADLLRVKALFAVLQSEQSALEKESVLIAELNHFLNLETYWQLRNQEAAEPESLNRVAEYLRANYRDGVTLDQLAAVAGVSKYQLLRLFKKVYRTPPHAFQMMLRINFAKEELRTKPERPVLAIAQDAGFFDQSHFVKTFKQYAGTTPVAYRMSQR